VSAVPLIFTSGWASGINSYAVVLLLGLFGRFGHMARVPPTLERTDVLCVAALLFLCQFVADKIQYVDSAWDIAHTVVRPVMGGAIGALMAGHAHGSLGAAAAGSLGGGAALVTHLARTGLRMGINASPEPVSNVIASIAGDLAVAGIVSLALLHPLLAATIAAALLLIGVVVVCFLVSRIRRFWRRRRERRLPARAHG
jgi:Domain of unknown function (DUF4126)